MSEFAKKLLKGLGIVMLGLVLGLAAYEGGKQLATPQVSAFEGEKVVPEIKMSEQKQEPLKPSVGNAVQTEKPKSLPVLVIRSKNTLVFNEVVTDKSVAQFQVKAQAMSNKLSADDEIIVVLYTPGGSVDAGMALMDTLKALPQKVKTLTIFAASMGFQFVQNLDERMILPSGVLMSHRAYGGMEGEIGGEFDVRFNAVKRQIEYMDRIAAARMQMSLEAYRDLIADEYWVHGFEAVDDRASDKLILARCDKDMVGTEEKEFLTIFGPIKVTFSKCPLITGPLEIKLDGISDMAKREEALSMTRMLYDTPKDFFKTYIKTRKFENIFIKDQK